MIAWKLYTVQFFFFSNPFLLTLFAHSFYEMRTSLLPTLSLFLLGRWHTSWSRGDSSHPIFWKALTAFNSLLSALVGIPATSMHSLLEYWALAQHCLSISTKRLDSKECACFATTFSDSSLLNLSFNLRIFLGIIFFSVSLHWRDSNIPISFLFVNLCRELCYQTMTCPFASVIWFDRWIWVIFIKILDNIYKNIEEYNPNKKGKILIVFDDMIANMLSNKNLKPIVTELFIRRRKVSISLVFITQFFLAVPKNLD